MSRTLVQFNDYVSLAVMLLMLVALVGSQTGATEFTARAAPAGPDAISASAPFKLEVDGHIGDQAIKLGLAVVGELSQFRGEDE